MKFEDGAVCTVSNDSRYIAEKKSQLNFSFRKSRMSELESVFLPITKC